MAILSSAGGPTITTGEWILICLGGATLLVSVLAVGIGLLVRRGPVSSLVLKGWRATLQPATSPQFVEISGTAFIAPVGSSFLVHAVEGTARFDGGARGDLKEEHDYPSRPVFEGSQALSLTFRVRGESALKSKRVHVSVSLKLADGAQRRVEEPLTIGT